MSAFTLLVSLCFYFVIDSSAALTSSGFFSGMYLGSSICSLVNGIEPGLHMPFISYTKFIAPGNAVDPCFIQALA